MASPVEAPKAPNPNILQRLPRLSTSVWMILILALFLIVMVPMATDYFEQISQQAAIQTQLDQVQAQLDVLESGITSQSIAAGESAKLKAEVEAAELQYKNVGDNPEVSKIIMDIAWDNDITIVDMNVSQSLNKILGTDYPVLSYSLSLSGQVANFQNFLIAVGKRIPLCQFTSVTIRPAQVYGELDDALINLQVYCNN
ncbi:MAG: hypothetical protein JW901_03595 [Dehalococcoidia bacterium]|nr:hypothetical protein [Dehalococcoidia bacterium]